MKTFLLWILSVGLLVSGLIHGLAYREIVDLRDRVKTQHGQTFRLAQAIDQLERRLFWTISDIETVSDEVIERCLTKQPRPPMTMKARKGK